MTRSTNKSSSPKTADAERSASGKPSIKQLINRSAQGDLKAMQMLLAIMQDIEHRSEAEPLPTTHL